MENCNFTKLSKKELINCLVKNLYYGAKWEYCLLQFHKRKNFTINIDIPSFNRSCTHVIIGCGGALDYAVGFVDLENKVAYSFYVSQSFLKMLCDGYFFKDSDYFSISAIKNDQEIMFVGTFILKLP